MFCQAWLVDLYTLREVYRSTLNLHRTFQFIGNFKVTQYFVTIARPHFKLLEFYIKIHGIVEKQFFSAQKAGKVTFF